MKATKRPKKPARATVESTKAGANLVNKIRFIARHRKLSQLEVWDAVAGPAVDIEFDRCVAEAKAAGR